VTAQTSASGPRYRRALTGRPCATQQSDSGCRHEGPGGCEEHRGVTPESRVRLILSIGEAEWSGTTRLFLLSSNEAGFTQTQIQIVQVAERLNIEHIVKLSALGASEHSNSTVAREHWDVEQALQQTGLHWTILRPHAFMQNWLGDVAESVRADGVIYSPIAEGRVPFIDARAVRA